MQIVRKYRIKNSFKLTGRGLVVLGDLLEGRVKVGGYLPLLGLTFVYSDEQQRNEYEVLKLQEQIVDILEGNN